MSSERPTLRGDSNQPSLLMAAHSQELVAECTLLVSAKGKIISANLLAQEILEASSLDILIDQRSLTSIISPMDRSLLVSLFDHAASGCTASSSVRLVSLNGNTRHTKFHITPSLDQTDQTKRFYCVFYDISNMKSLEAELQLSNLRLAEAQTHAKLGSWERNLMTQKGTWSKEMYRLFDVAYAQEPPTFSMVANMIHPQDRQKFIELHDKYIKDGNDYSVDVRLQKQDGEILWIEARSETIRDDDGRALLLRGTAQDITERKLHEAEILFREQTLAASQTRAKVSSWQLDIASNSLTGSNEHFRLIEQVPNQGRADSDQFMKQVHPDDLVGVQEHLKKITTTVGQSGFTYRFVLADGSIRWLQGLEETLADDNNQPYRIVGTMQDITERVLAKQKLQETKDLLDATQSIAKLGGWEIDLRTNKVLCTNEVYRILETNPEDYKPSFEDGTGRYTPESLEKIKRLFENAISKGQDFDAELRTYTFKENIRDVRITGRVIFENNTPVKLMGIYQDITEQKKAQNLLEIANNELEKKNQSLERIANYDSLTHLPNRVLLSDRLEQAIVQSQRRHCSIAVAFLDLDGFKSINDKFGHSIGDEFLVRLATNLKHSLRECDTLARIGGDEFVAILTDITTASDHKPMIHRLLVAAAGPIYLQNQELQVSASIGVTIFPDDGVDAEQLLRHADQAMYLAKQAGKNQYHMFDVHQDTQVKTLHEELDRIRKAHYDHEFVLFYQPKVNLSSGCIIGSEALIRWQHPTKGLLSPAEFLPIVQDHIFSIDLGEWVIDSALRQLELWLDIGIKTKISVNVSAMQLQQDDFVSSIKYLLSKHPRIESNQLELEILEISAINDVNKVTTMIHQCQEFGITFALDDFGTGYSSLSYLKKLPTDTIKIDQSFVRDMLVDNEDLSIVKGIIGLSNVFKRQVIAEGVETKAHCDKLLSIGCELAQGYGIAKPMPAEQFEEWSKEWLEEHVN